MTGTGGRGTGPATPPPGQMTEAEFRSLYERLRGQARWGPDDRRGALNYITPARVLAACAEVRLGRTVSLAAPVEDRAAPDNPDPAQHQMTGLLGRGRRPGAVLQHGPDHDEHSWRRRQPPRRPVPRDL